MIITVDFPGTSIEGIDIGKDVEGFFFFCKYLGSHCKDLCYF